MNKKTSYIIIFSLLVVLTIGTVFTDYTKQLGTILADASVPNPGHSLSEIEGGQDLATKSYVNTAIAGITQGSVTSVGTGDGLTGGPITSSGTISVDSTVVRTTGNQTLGGTKTFSSPVVASYYNVNSGVGNGIRFWASDEYKISMGNTAEYKYGSVTDYSIKMNMSNTPTRGWTWGVVGVAPVAAINTQGNMSLAGSVVANAFYYTSDIRKKENVTNIENSLSKILQLQGISYNLKGEEDKRMGFSAQDLQKVYPELVKEGSDGYLSIDGTGLIAPLVESIKEQQKKIEELEEKINILMQK